MCVAKRKNRNGLAPCRRYRDAWPVCFSNDCYMNYRCPTYRGLFPNPERDYVPLPPVFIRLKSGEARAVSYHIPVITDLE